MRRAAALVVPAALLALAACSSAPSRDEQAQSPAPTQQARKGGYYKDDGPGDNPPANLDAIPDAVPRNEPLHRFANRPYQVFGRDYVPVAAAQPYRQRGIASWYGRRFHGQKTSSGELYDMYAMSAAHTTLPIPSYVRVTSIANGRSVVVRINDRGPFHPGRIIDLSYAAAHRLGIAQAGSGEVEVESVGPGEQIGAKAVTPAVAATSGVYVQLGAFSSRDNAESLRERVAREAASLREGAQVLMSGNLWRLQIGPYGSQEAARVVADRMEKILDLKALLIVR